MGSAREDLREAVAWMEDRAAELEYHAARHKADHGAKRDAARYRTILAALLQGAPCQECDAVSAAIGDVEFMDPPDGGSVTLSEQVGRMRQALTEARAALPQGEAEPAAWRWRFDADGAWVHGSQRPGKFRFGDPEEMQALYRHPAHPTQPAPDRVSMAALRLANAADAYGVQHLDTDDMDAEAVELQAATLALRALLATGGE